MNPTLKLLQIIDSPFAPAESVKIESRIEAIKLYEHAKKNKIGLLYLEALRKEEVLEKFGLLSEWQKENRRYNEQLTTVARFSSVLNSLNVEYAVFKSVMPFKMVPNDVDVLFFGSDEEYYKLVEVLPNFGYEKIVDVPSPVEVMFHDLRSQPHEDPKEKDVFDVDLYREAGASYMVYLDKRKLRKHITEVYVFEERVKVLKPEADLIALYTHAIIPEFIFTLSLYYITLYYLSKMKKGNLKNLLSISKENHVICPLKYHCSLIAGLHKAAHGFVPEKIKVVLAELGEETNERKNLVKTSFMMPHHYSWSIILRMLLEKAGEDEFRRSMIKQILYMLLNPKLAKWVICNVMRRRRRETY